jgi:hypothetical protein
MASRNWMMRRLIVDSIRNDPQWQDGNYTTQPKSAQFASVFYGIATNGGTLAMQKAAPTGEQADRIVNQRLAAPFAGDANVRRREHESPFVIVCDARSCGSSNTPAFGQHHCSKAPSVATSSLPAGSGCPYHRGYSREVTCQQRVQRTVSCCLCSV